MKGEYPKPPKWADRFLAWYCRADLLEDLQGDLYEYFDRNVYSKGARRARLIFVLDVLKFLRPYTVRKPHLLDFMFNFFMLSSYIKTSRRTLVRNKLFSAINIFGLGVSMSVGLLMIAMLLDVFSYDGFHENKDRIYRVISRLEQNGNSNSSYFATTSLLAGKTLEQGVDGIADVAVLKGGLSADFETADRKIPLSGYYTGDEFFEVFSFKLLQGNPATALRDPFQIVLTESAADKLFGDSGALGKTLIREGREYLISGIMQDPPLFSHIKFELLGSLSTLDITEKVEDGYMRWDQIYNTWAYALLEEGVDPKSLKAGLDLYSATQDQTLENTRVELDLEPLGSIMLGENLGNQIGPTLGKTTLKIFLGLTLVLLISACFNYTNLSVARALSRTREVGIRKTIGAHKSQIVGQFIVESVLISLLALGFSLLLFLLIRPHFLGMAPSLQQLLSLQVSPELLLFFVVFAIAIGLFAGLVPAISFSRINAVVAFRKMLAGSSKKKLSLRKSLTVFQYSISIIAITATLILFNQYKHFIHFDLGFNTENVFNISLQGLDPELLANELSHLSEVQEISRSKVVSGIGHYWGVMMVNPNDPLDSMNVYYNAVDENYLPLHGYTLIAGTNLHPVLADSLESEVLVNQEVLKRFAIASGVASEAVGQLVKIGGKQLTIVGVLEDFEYGKANNQTGKEVVIRYSREGANYLNVKVLSSDMSATYAKMESIWKKLDPVHPFEGRFYDQQIQDGFKGFEASVKVGGFLSLLVICIASIGLLGMVVFTTEQRIKEVGIRKVMGSSEAELIGLLSKGFMVLLALASAIAIPSTYLFFSEFLLPQIPNSAPVQFPEMIVGSLAVLAIALGMIVSQTLKVARTDPAKVLNRE